jgi:chromosome segregation ATPase
VETEISSEKPDIENQPLTESQTIKKLNRSNQKLERQAAKQQQTIQQQQEKLNQYRQEIKDYKQKLSASEQKNESLNKQVEKLKFAESSLEQANLQNQRLQEQLISLQKQYEFLAADAKSKQKMYDILNEIIDKTTITLGKMKSFVKVSLIAGRGEYPETTINDALYDLHRALESTDIKDGYQLENQALARLGDKPRRLTKKRKQ